MSNVTALRQTNPFVSAIRRVLQEVLETHSVLRMPVSSRRARPRGSPRETGLKREAGFQAEGMKTPSASRRFEDINEESFIPH